MSLLWQPFFQIHLKTGELLTRTRHAALKHTMQPRRTPVHVRKFKDISDEVPSCSLRNPWQQDTAGSCCLPGIQTLSQLSRTKKKKIRLHKSRCEIILKVFPLPNQKNKPSADRGNRSVGTAAAENLFLAAWCSAPANYRGSRVYCELHVHACAGPALGTCRVPKTCLGASAPAPRSAVCLPTPDTT